MSTTALKDDVTPYDLEARQIRKQNIRADRRLQTFLRKLEKSHKGRVNKLDRQITETKLDARVFKFEKEKTAVDLFRKYHKLAMDIEKQKEEETKGSKPVSPTRSRTFHKSLWQNPESEEFKTRLSENYKVLSSEVARRIRSEPPRMGEIKYGRLDIPSNSPMVRSGTFHSNVRTLPQISNRSFGYTFKTRSDKRSPTVGYGSRFKIKQRNEMKVLPVNPATAQINSLWESNPCLSRGHAPIGGIHFEIPFVTGKAINGNSGDLSGKENTQLSNSEPVGFRLPKMDHLTVPFRKQKFKTKKNNTDTTYSVQILL